MFAKALVSGVLGGLAAGGLAVGGCAYAAKWPTSQIYGRTILAGKDIDELALTFDDGPNDVHTHHLLELLAGYRVRATFFLIGDYVKRRPELARAVQKAGHLVGNHTMTHPSLMFCSAARVREELKASSAAIEDVTGTRIEYFRPPFGARRPDVLQIARDLGLAPVMWNLTAHDWDATDARLLATRIERGVSWNRRLGRGSNILLHDGSHRELGADRSATVGAVGQLLARWDAGMSRLVTVDAWAK